MSPITPNYSANVTTRLEHAGLISSSGRLGLHVLTLTPFFPFAANSVYGTYVSEPIEHFADHNLRSTVIGVSPVYHRRRDPVSGLNSKWLRYPQLPGNLGLTTAGLLLYRRLAAVLRRLHRQNPIHVIHAHATLPCGHAASLLSRHLQIPFVVTIHGLDVFNACFEPGTSAARRRAEVSAEVYRRAASVICISHAIQGILDRGMSTPVGSRVIYNGTDPNMFSPAEGSSAQQTPNILIVGNLLRGKGHEIVLHAMSKITNRFPDLRCHMIGEGSDRDRFAALATNLGLADRIVFHGRQSRQAVAKAMQECTVFALPSRFEGLGCAYLEAMACAKPVIACEGQGIAEIIEHKHNGWLIPVDGVDEMVNALLQLLDSPEVRVQIGLRARQTILGSLTLKDQVSRLGAAYRDAVRA